MPATTGPRPSPSRLARRGRASSARVVKSDYSRNVRFSEPRRVRELLCLQLQTQSLVRDLFWQFSFLFISAPATYWKHCSESTEAKSFAEGRGSLWNFDCADCGEALPGGAQSCIFVLRGIRESCALSTRKAGEIFDESCACAVLQPFRSQCLSPFVRPECDSIVCSWLTSSDALSEKSRQLQLAGLLPAGVKSTRCLTPRIRCWV